MSETNSASRANPPPAQTLLRMANAFHTSQAIHVAAELALADHLAGGPLSAEALATATNTHAPTLRRLLRMLASLDVLTEDEQGLYDLTAVGAELKSAPAGSPRDAVLFVTSEWVWRAWGELIYSVRTGKPAFDYVWSMNNFEFWGRNSEMGRLFDRGLAAITTQHVPALVAAYDYSQFGTIVDVGGGQGALLSAILQANPAAQGILFDLPQVAARAEEALAQSGLAERCRVVGGSFFESAPPGGDAYLLKFILHDWDDERASHILQVVHQAMRPGSTLLILEQVMPSRIEPTEHLQEFFRRDIKMLVETSGGRQRTAGEFRALLDAAGFEMRTIHPTRSILSIVESVRA